MGGVVVHENAPATGMERPRRRHLPVLQGGAPSAAPEGQAGAPGDDPHDPLVVLRGGRFARWFAVTCAVFGLAWIVGAKASARSPEGAVFRLHTAFAGGEEPGHWTKSNPENNPKNNQENATPPPLSIEKIEKIDTLEQPGEGLGAPPPLAIDDLPTNKTGAGEAVDRFGRRRTAAGALILGEGGGLGDDRTNDPNAPNAPGGPAGLTEAQHQAFSEGGFFDAEIFADAAVVERKAYVHLMPGIPNEAFFAGAALIILLSFAVFERYGGRRDPRRRQRRRGRLELSAWAPLRRALRSRWLQPALQLPVVIGFLAVIVIGLVGSQEPGRNLAPVLTWNVWWIGLIFLVLFAGNFWCAICPWTAIPDWIMRRSLVRVRPVASLGAKYPRARLWIWPAIVLFAGVTWLELAFDAANRPWLTSLLGIAMIALSWLLLVVYERKAMCRYVCFVGRVSGQYAMMGLLELRRRDNDTCRKCATKDCFHGNDRGYPCPTHEFMGAMNENQYCTLCTECIKTCPHDNIALNLRPSGADLLEPHRGKIDEAYLALLVFIVSAFHGAAMIPLWMEWEDRLRTAIIDLQVATVGSDLLGFAGTHGGTATFTLMMLACIILPGLLYLGLCAAMWALSGRREIGIRRLFIRFAFTLLPIALFYHLAHNAVHVFWEWSKLRRLASDPLGWGHDLFGTARAPLTALWTPESIWYLQVGLVVIGHIYGIYVAQREAYRVYGGDRRASLRAHLVMMAGMILMSLLSLWLLAQPMFMRTADI